MKFPQSWLLHRSERKHRKVEQEIGCKKENESENKR
uniref:Uncharacterized protein n=1 Tax=Ascaris lumbricoides TaxID=6252 RepID=A0A0M3ID79_ASCLU